jgi:hypothetical protein
MLRDLHFFPSSFWCDLRGSLQQEKGTDNSELHSEGRILS